MAHVALRAATKDFNISTPTLIDNTVEDSNIRNSIHKEAGYIAERNLFNGLIDWVESATSELNLDYCKTFLENLLNGLASS